MVQKSYNGTPNLYLIPTPIGNFEDITLRSIKYLEEVKVIFSEDTRETMKLLNKFNIKKKLLSLHKFNEKKVKYKILEYLNKGESVAIVSDRGTPCISDPGFECSAFIINNGYNVVGLPGATAFIPALIASNITPYPFVFYGFLNHKKSKKQKELKKLKDFSYTFIFYESPHRILETLDEIHKEFGNRYICIAREISKINEHLYRGKIEDVKKEIEVIKGEFVLIVEGKKNNSNESQLSEVDQINFYIKEGLTERKSIKMVSKERNLDKNEVYKDYLKRK